MKKNLAIFLAGGSGSRFGMRHPKQFHRISGKAILEYALEKFDHHPLIHDIVVVVHPRYHRLMTSIIKSRPYEKVKKILPGGRSRQESACSGVMAADDDVENVLIHDAARPMVSEELIGELLRVLGEHAVATPAVEPTDTIAEINDQNMIADIPDRKLLRHIQTPQGFKLDIIRQAHALAREQSLENFSDDCSLILFFGLSQVFVIPGSECNIKITRPEDLMLMKKLLKTS